MKPETIRETVHSWEQNPEKAKTKPTVKVRSDGAQAVIEAGPFTWRADLPSPLGGTNQARSPTALLLGALGGCAVVSFGILWLRSWVCASTRWKRLFNAIRTRAACWRWQESLPTCKTFR